MFIKRRELVHLMTNSLNISAIVNIIGQSNGCFVHNPYILTCIIHPHDCFLLSDCFFELLNHDIFPNSSLK